MSKDFRKFIYRKMLGEVNFETTTNQYSIDTISLNQQDLSDIYGEGNLRGYSKDYIDDVLAEVVYNDNINSPSKVKEYINLDLKDIKIEGHVKLFWLSDENGQCFEELVKIDKSIFLLIDHNRGSLSPGSYLKVARPFFQLGHKVEFILFDELKESAQIYTTGKLNKIEIIDVPPIFKVYQAKENTLRKKVFAGPPDKKRGFLADKLSFTLDKDKYFTLEQKLGIADFYHLPNNIDFDNILEEVRDVFEPVCYFENLPQEGCSKILTIQKGRLRYNEGYWELIERAKIRFE